MSPPKKTIKQYESEAVWISGCWIHKTYGVPRKLYMLRHKVTLPSDIAVCHKCDNPFCIFDKHHFTGTWKDNVMDAVRKGRHSCFRKGGVRFSGKHTEEALKKIQAASLEMWRKRRENS